MASITLKDINDTLKGNHEETKEESRLAREDLAKFLATFQESMREKTRKEKAESSSRRLADIENKRESTSSKGLIGNTLSGAGDAASGLGAGIGDIFKGLGVAGAGIGAFFLALAGAEAIMSKFGDGENLKNLLTNLATGIGSFGTSSILALGGLFAAGGLFGAVAGVGKSFKGGFGIAAIGAGISAFLVEMSIADALIGNFGDGSSFATLLGNIGKGINSLTGISATALGGLFAAGGLFGAVAGVGGTGKATIGIAALGAGIALFFTSLAGGDFAIEQMQATGQWLGGFVTTMSEVINSLTLIDAAAFAGLFATGAVFGAIAGPVASGKATIGIAAIGAGIAAFFTALAGGDFAIEKMQATGANLKTLVGNIIDSINLFDAKSAAVIGGLIAVGGIFGPSMIGAGVGIAAIGTSIGLFFAGIGAGDAMITAMSNLTGGKPGEGFRDLLVNTVDGIKKFAELKDLPDLGAIGNNLISLSGGLLAFFGTEGIMTLQGLAGEVGEKIAGVLDSLFGTDLEGEFKKGIIDRLIEGLEPLKNLDPAIITQMDTLGTALRDLTDSFATLSNLSATGISTGLVSMLEGVAGVLAVKENLINGGVYDGIGLGNARDIDFGAGLKNFTDENMNIISEGISKLYAAMNVPTPMQGAQLRAGGGGSGSSGGATNVGVNYNPQSSQTTNTQVTINGTSDPPPARDYPSRFSYGR